MAATVGGLLADFSAGGRDAVTAAAAGDSTLASADLLVVTADLLFSAGTSSGNVFDAGGFSASSGGGMPGTVSDLRFFVNFIVLLLQSFPRFLIFTFFMKSTLCLVKHYRRGNTNRVI